MQTLLLYDVMELECVCQTGAANRFEVPVEAAFVHEEGERMNVPGFYDGDDRFKVRFMPTRPGVWQYSVTIDGRIVDSDAFQCAASSLKGPLRQDERHPHHFVFANGDPFYMFGNTAYSAIAAYRRRKEDFLGFLDYYAARNFNWVRFFLAQSAWPHHGEKVWPWAGKPEDLNFDEFNLPCFREAEAVIRELAARNTIASVILLHGDREYTALREDRLERCKAYFRYAVARLGAYWNVVWNVANEWHRDGIFQYNEIDQLGAYLHAVDPYKRLISCHHYARFEFPDKHWTSMSSLQHRGAPHEINRIMLQNRQFGKVAINEEYGYERDNHYPPNDPDNVRHDHWAIAMAGGYGTYGDKTKGPKIGTYMSSVLEDAIGTQAPDTLRHLPMFMSAVGYREMSPGNFFVTECNEKEVFCLANPGKEYAVYMVKGQEMTINLTHVSGSLSVRWFNPVSGEYTEAGEVTIAQNVQDVPGATGEEGWGKLEKLHLLRFAPPDTEQDWVLHLRKR